MVISHSYWEKWSAVNDYLSTGWNTTWHCSQFLFQTGIKPFGERLPGCTEEILVHVTFSVAAIAILYCQTNVLLCFFFLCKILVNGDLVRSHLSKVFVFYLVARKKLRLLSLSVRTSYGGWTCALERKHSLYTFLKASLIWMGQVSLSLSRWNNILEKLFLLFFSQHLII